MRWPDDLLPLTYRLSRMLIFIAFALALGLSVTAGVSRGYFARAVAEVKQVQTWSVQTWKAVWPLD